MANNKRKYEEFSRDACKDGLPDKITQADIKKIRIDTEYNMLVNARLYISNRYVLHMNNDKFEMRIDLSNFSQSVRKIILKEMSEKFLSIRSTNTISFGESLNKTSNPSCFDTASLENIFHVDF